LWTYSEASEQCFSPSPPPPHGGTPKRILPIPRNPIKTFTGKKTKGQLVRQGDYASISNCRTKFPLCFEGYLEFSVAFKSFYIFPFHPLHLWRYSPFWVPFFLRRRRHSSPSARLHPRILKISYFCAISRGTSNDVLRNSRWETLLQMLSYPARHLCCCVSMHLLGDLNACALHWGN
jgi:hypothetical protein